MINQWSEINFGVERGTRIKLYVFLIYPGRFPDGVPNSKVAFAILFYNNSRRVKPGKWGGVQNNECGPENKLKFVSGAVKNRVHLDD